MKILNIMLSRDLGGIQQAFIDYTTALSSPEIELVNITSFFAKINNHPLCKNQLTVKLPNFGPWDFLSTCYLQLIIKFLKPEIIIAHGNRAITFARNHFQLNNAPILIGVAHNYSVQSLKRCHYIIALTEHMQNYLIKQNFLASRIKILPNMLTLKKAYSPKLYQNTLVIGVLARLVKKKGVDILLRSLKILKDQGYRFKALIGGDGSEKAYLINLAKSFGLNDQVSFTGWIQDQDEFLDRLDLFCLPSLHEPFGIIILEAIARSVPVIASRTEGPQEILRDKQDGLLCCVGSSTDLAIKLAHLINNQDEAQQMSASAYGRLVTNYDLKIVAPQLIALIKAIIWSRSQARPS